MGTYTGSIAVRDGLNASAQSVINLFNTITDAMIGCGMVPVPNEEIPGQAGIFVIENPGPGQKAVLPLETSGNNEKGFNWFRHPTLPFSVKIKYMYSSRNTFGSLGWISWGLMRDGFQTDLPWWIPFSTSSGDTNLSIPDRITPLRASCGPDHFWLAPGILTIPNANGNLSPLRGVSFGLAVFQAGPNFVAMIGNPSSTPGSSGVSGPNNNSFIINAHRVYQSEPGMPFVEKLAGSLNTFFDPTEPIATEGIRVSQGAKYISGQRYDINLGWAQYILLQDNQMIPANITGEPQTYLSMLGFGSGNPAYYASNSTNALEGERYVSGPLLPWAEGWTP